MLLCAPALVTLYRNTQKSVLHEELCLSTGASINLLLTGGRSDSCRQRKWREHLALRQKAVRGTVRSQFPTG